MQKETLTRATMAKYLTDEIGLPRREAQQIVSRFISTITQALVSGDSILLTGLGKFIPVDRAARIGRNPNTGKRYRVPSRRTVTFRTGRRLKQRFAGKG